MPKITKAACFLLLLQSFLGCHHDEPVAVLRARGEQGHQKQFFTDRVSLQFAQQELALANQKAAVANTAGQPVDVTAEQAAEHHVQQAELQLKIDRDDEQIDADRESAVAFATMLKALPSREDHP